MPSITSIFDVKEKETYSSKMGKEVSEFWKRLYKEHVGLEYRVSVAEKANLKSLIIEYGVSDVKKVIEYYMENYNVLTYVKGYPSIHAMMGFRRTLFPEVLIGSLSAKKSGQYSDAVARELERQLENKKGGDSHEESSEKSSQESSSKKIPQKVRWG